MEERIEVQVEQAQDTERYKRLEDTEEGRGESH